MLHNQCQKVVEGLDALHSWAEGTDGKAETVKDFERESDELRRILIE
jgi:hypothetical protein